MKYYYLLLVILSMAATLSSATQHKLGWTLFGMCIVGLNIYNLLNTLGR